LRGHTLLQSSVEGGGDPPAKEAAAGHRREGEVGEELTREEEREDGRPRGRGE